MVGNGQQKKGEKPSKAKGMTTADLFLNPDLRNGRQIGYTFEFCDLKISHFRGHYCHPFNSNSMTDDVINTWKEKNGSQPIV